MVMSLSLLLYLRKVSSETPDLSSRNVCACTHPVRSRWKQRYLKLDRITLATSHSQLCTAQEVVGDACEDEAEFKANIHPIGRIEQISDGSDIINLRGSEQNSSKTDDCGEDSGPPNGKLPARIPIFNVVAPTTKDEMFQDQDDRPGTQPVCDEQQEIGECHIKVGRSSYGDKHVDHRPDECPHRTGDTLERLAQYLH